MKIKFKIKLKITWKWKLEWKCPINTEELAIEILIWLLETARKFWDEPESQLDCVLNNLLQLLNLLQTLL